MKNGDKPVANPHVVLREEFDDWAVLFNPDAVLGFAGFGLNPTGVYLWKLLDGEHTMAGLLEELRQHADNVPEGAGDHIGPFVDALVEQGLAGYGDGSCRKKCPPTPLGALNDVGPFTYEPPKLVNLGGGQTAHGDCGGGSSASCCSSNGHLATSLCTSGGSGTYCSCNAGTCGKSDGGCTCTGSCVDGPNCSCGMSDACGGPDVFCETGSCAVYNICYGGSSGDG